MTSEKKKTELRSSGIRSSEHFPVIMSLIRVSLLRLITFDEQVSICKEENVMKNITILDISPQYQF